MKTFIGTVESGIGKASIEMANSDGLEDWKTLTGLEILPGTLNLLLEKPFDLSLLKYLSFSEIGWDFDPSTQGHATISPNRSLKVRDIFSINKF